MRTTKLLLAGLVTAGLSSAGHAATEYTSPATFLSQLAAGAYTETFTGLTDPASNSLGFASGGFAYTASAPSGLYVSAGFLGTNQIDQALTISFTSGNVKAFAASFFVTDISDQFQPVAVRLNLSDGTSTTFTPTTIVDSFRGYTSNVAIASVTIAAPGQSRYASLDDLVVGTVSAVPEPAAFVLMSVGLLGLLAGARLWSAAAR